MVELIEKLPDGLRPPLPESESGTLPVVRIEGRDIVIPVLVRKETRYEYTPDEEESAREVEVFLYFDIRTKYLGGDPEDYAAICRTHYAGLREALYGSAEYQDALDYDHEKTAHILAVKDAIRKPGQTDPPDGIARWNQVKASFWALVDAACAEVGKTRDDLPGYFNDVQMLQFASENGMTEARISYYTLMFGIANNNAGSNGRNWCEFFR